MQADFAVELGPDDETLDFPWSDESSGLRYLDLKRRPEVLSEIAEACACPELGEFLSAVNAAASILETAKCDAWHTTEMTVEDEIFGGPCKFGSYVDLLFADGSARLSFLSNEQLAKRLVNLLKKVPEIPASAEFLVRRCFFPGDAEARDAFYITFYLFGYGEDEAQARQRWAIALKLAENAILQVSRMDSTSPRLERP